MYCSWLRSVATTLGHVVHGGHGTRSTIERRCKPYVTEMVNASISRASLGFQQGADLLKDPCLSTWLAWYRFPPLRCTRVRQILAANLNLRTAVVLMRDLRSASSATIFKY